MNIRINLYKKQGPLDFLGWMLAVQQRSGITHAAFEIDGVYWGTGARWHWLKGPVFGQTDAVKYNQGRQYYQCEFVAPLTEAQEQELLSTLKSLEGQPYGYAKVLRLVKAGNTHGDFLCGLGEATLDIKNPFCSESVVFACWKIGRMVCRRLCKKEPEVCAPNDLYIEALYQDILKIVGTVGIPKEEQAI